MNAGGNYILASYISLFGPFVPHALRGAVTKCRFNTPLVHATRTAVATLDLASTCRV